MVTNNTRWPDTLDRAASKWGGAGWASDSGWRNEEPICEALSAACRAHSQPGRAGDLAASGPRWPRHRHAVALAGLGRGAEPRAERRAEPLQAGCLHHLVELESSLTMDTQRHWLRSAPPTASRLSHRPAQPSSAHPSVKTDRPSLYPLCPLCALYPLSSDQPW